MISREPDLSFCFFLLDYNFDPAGNVTVQLDGHIEIAQVLERIMKLDLAAINIKTFGRETFGDITRSDGAKEMVLLSGFALKGESNAVELFRQSFGIVLFH